MQPNRSYCPSELDEHILSRLADLPLGEIRYYKQIDSTNDEASHWASLGAPDLSMVIADEQTAGRGRHQRKWFTPPNSALAFSLIVRGPDHSDNYFRGGLDQEISPVRWTALGAVSICLALEELYSIQPRIKWPNDVLINGRKTAGILVEGHWQSSILQGIILGIGINTAPPSVPPDDQILFPATCIETAAGHPIDRFDLLHAIIRNVISWRKDLYQPIFIQTWDHLLAFKGQKVYFLEGTPFRNNKMTGTLVGLDELGRLKIQDRQGREHSLTTGELTLRPYLDKHQLFPESED